jgi:hypothetical protein
MTPFFIHIPKNGGMTIRRSPLINVALANERTQNASHIAGLKAKMKATGDHPGIEHARWRDLKPEVQKSCKPFAVIRNPWDRVVSRYFFAKKVIEVEKKVPTSYADVSSFEAFLEERHKWGDEPYMWHRAVRGWYPAWDHLCDDSGQKRGPIDILRFESYNEDFRQYFGVLTNPAPRNVTAINKQSYQDIYTPETIQIVADWYAKDINTWGYDFDTGPTKNTWAIR